MSKRFEGMIFILAVFLFGTSDRFGDMVELVQTEKKKFGVTGGGVPGITKEKEGDPKAVQAKKKKKKVGVTGGGVPGITKEKEGDKAERRPLRPPRPPR